MTVASAVPLAAPFAVFAPQPHASTACWFCSLFEKFTIETVAVSAMFYWAIT
jgi:predicted cobalt transporter CbtA